MKEEREGAMSILPRALPSLQWNSNTKRYENREDGEEGRGHQKSGTHFPNAAGMDRS